MTKLFVYGVNSSCPKDLIEDEFSRCGKVTDIYITGKGNKAQVSVFNNKYNDNIQFSSIYFLLLIFLLYLVV